MVTRKKKQSHSGAKSLLPELPPRGDDPPFSNTITLKGLRQEARIIRDRWGVPHIYAATVHDLFFAQGFVTAQDRLWQMEFWRRSGEGTLSEIVGQSAVQRDKFARLLRYRGNMDVEWKSYGRETRFIVSAFVKGINAYIENNRSRLPVEFQILGIEPRPWTPETCLSRFTTFTLGRNASSEVLTAELVKAIGVKRTAALLGVTPADLTTPRGVNLENVDLSVLKRMSAFVGPLQFDSAGSNNWVVSGALTESGKPILANDPHRIFSVPSVRYVVHLVGPGWNVIGAADPFLPGVSTGHNERIAFGFTVFRMDQQDIYIEKLHPSNPRRYRYNGRWHEMTIEREQIRVRDQKDPVNVELCYTHHGPSIFEDPKRNRAYTLRWIGSEPGSAGFLASLTLNRANNWRQFVAGLRRWKAPPENFVYADVDGNIGWQVAGAAPKREKWTGLLPVSGTSGEYEWKGFIPISELPRTYNPRSQFIATANNNVVPPGSKHKFGYEWADRFRRDRIEEVIRDRKAWNVTDFQKLQVDEVSLPARELVALLNDVVPKRRDVKDAIALIKNWNYELANDSSAAALFEVWVARLFINTFQPLVTQELWSRIGKFLSVQLLIDALTGRKAILLRSHQLSTKQLVTKSLLEAIKELNTKLGKDITKWRWGDLHFVEFKHPLSDISPNSLGDPIRVPCGGDLDTVNGTSGEGFAVTVGASYRQIIDLADWDNSVAINVPGQSGQPESCHYKDLIPLWRARKYFPLLFTGDKIKANASNFLVLKASQSKNHR